MLTTSDDNTAESLLKEIGLVASGAGTRAAGSAAVLETLASWGLPTEGIVITDGSGLDRSNVLTCELLVGVLDHAGTSGTIHDALPVAGTSGTLADVFVGTPVQGVLRAKTGTLSGAKSLSGYYPATDGSIDAVLARPERRHGHGRCLVAGAVDRSRQRPRRVPQRSATGGSRAPPSPAS